MLREQESLGSPEKAFKVFQNRYGATIPKGASVVALPDPFGMAYITRPTAATLSLWVGIADEDIPDQAYGRIQVEGFDDDALVLNDTVATRNPGDILVPVANQFYLTYAAASDGLRGYVVMYETVNPTTPAAALGRKVWIR